MSKAPKVSRIQTSEISYDRLIGNVSAVLESARRNSARAVNTFMTGAYWEIGRYIVEYEQSGVARAEYGERLLRTLSEDLSKRFGRGFAKRNLDYFRAFYLSRPIVQTISAQSGKGLKINNFPLPWSHYVRLLSVKNELARKYYEEQAFQLGWTGQQLDRQINARTFERAKGKKSAPVSRPEGGRENADEGIRDSFVLEFLNLKDEYSESDLEESLILHMEKLLLELGGDFSYVGRQRRLRVGDSWFRIDLVFFNRRLKCLVLIDLKTGKFSPADAGQMHFYLNYAKAHWILEGENPPVGLVLSAGGDGIVAKYALEGLPNQVMASQYRLSLPDEKEIEKELNKTRLRLLNP